VQIVPPFGYREVVPFQKLHRVRLPGAGEMPEFVRRGNAMPISHAEFLLVARDYPIVFATNDQGKSFAAVAVLGMSTAENLFFSDAGWAGRVYIPAYVRRYPFCMARVRSAKSAQPDHLICVEKEFIDEQRGEALFDAKGAPAERWLLIERLLSEYEADLERTREMCSTLADYGVLEPFTMQATLSKEKGGGSLKLSGMHRVNEKSLGNLNAAQLKNLMRKGLLARIYLHLASLENFSRLLERKAARSAAPS
jgi:hypothetical protein